MRDENERLKREIAKITTENEILKATSSFGPLPHSTQGRRSSTRQDDEILKTGPMKYTPTDFTPSLTSTHSDNLHHQNRPSQHSSHSQLHSSLPSSSSPVLSSQSSTHRITISPLTGRRLLSAGAVWDFIQAHELVKDGLADITDVTARLKEAAECDGTGPAFEEGKLVRAIEESAGVS